MADKIKKFFAKKKADARFKLAGPGHKLNESSTSVVTPGISKPTTKVKRSPPGEATRQAAEAALIRLQNQQSRNNTGFNTSLAAIQAQVRRELEAEKKGNIEEVVKPTSNLLEEYSPHLAVKGVYFTCPLIGEEVLSKEEWRRRIKEFLFEQLEEERGLTACLIIYSCNYNRTKVKECVEVLCKYLDNIIANPTEAKFHKIRCSNATFKDKVLPILGATELLYAAGFRQQKLEHNGNEEEFWVWNQNNLEDGLETLQFLRNNLVAEERVDLVLDRNLQVLSPAQVATRVELPTDFYALTPEEIKREQQLRSENVEKQLQLRTKAMREKDEMREVRKYKFTLIRIRFPDGLYLQGTFSVYEKFSDVLDFVQIHLEHSGLPFLLTSPTGHKFEESDYELSLAQLKLVPAIILNFQWDPSIVEQAANISKNISYLKPETAILIQNM